MLIIFIIILSLSFITSRFLSFQLFIKTKITNIYLVATKITSLLWGRISLLNYNHPERYKLFYLKDFKGVVFI